VRLLQLGHLQLPAGQLHAGVDLDLGLTSTRVIDERLVLLDYRGAMKASAVSFRTLSIEAVAADR
jgi:hypothetical protein